MSESRNFDLDVMIDLETLGTAPNAVILSIGAVMFRRTDAAGFFVGDFYRNLTIDDQLAHGKIDGSALRWWLEQSDAARARLFDPEPVSAKYVIDDLSDWLTRVPGDLEFRIWSHGENFDIPILDSLCRSIWGDVAVWRYSAARDTRTLFDAVGMDWDTRMEEVATKLGGAPHDALFDAKVQARMVQEAWAVLEAVERGIES